MRHHEIKLCDVIAVTIVVGGMLMAWKMIRFIFNKLKEKYYGNPFI